MLHWGDPEKYLSTRVAQRIINDVVSHTTINAMTHGDRPRMDMVIDFGRGMGLDTVGINRLLVSAEYPRILADDEIAVKVSDHPHENTEREIQKSNMNSIEDSGKPMEQSEDRTALRDPADIELSPEAEIILEHIRHRERFRACDEYDLRLIARSLDFAVQDDSLVDLKITRNK